MPVSTIVLGSAACALALIGLVLGSDGRPTPRHRPTRSRARSAFLIGLGILTATISFAVVLLPPPGARVPLVAVVLLLSPGYALLAFRGMADVVDEFTIALGMSVALLVLSGTAMVTLAFWHPVELAGVASVVIAPILTWCGALGFREYAPASVGALVRVATRIGNVRPRPLGDVSGRVVVPDAPAAAGAEKGMDCDGDDSPAGTDEAVPGGSCRRWWRC